MSFTQGPCPRCGRLCVYDGYSPTPCKDCRQPDPDHPDIKNVRVHVANAVSRAAGNRRQRRAMKAKQRKV
jgi:hypothetical protein